MKKFVATLQHDNGKIKISTVAMDEETAREMICKAEGCPPSSIIKMTDAGPQLYKVVRVSKKSAARKIVERNLTFEEARRLVKSTPTTDKAMTVFFKQ